MIMRTLPALLLVMATLALAAAPDFELPDLDGNSHRLADYRGQWVVVNYWATWCKPCRKEIPDLSELHDQRDDLVVLGIAWEDTEVEVFERFLAQYPASFPILQVDVYDPPAALEAPRALPTTRLINPEGALVNTWVGPVTGEMIADWIREQQ